MDKNTFHVPPGSEVRTCKRCPQRLAMRVTDKGRLQPMNLPDGARTKLVQYMDRVAPVEVTRDPFEAECHFSDCPAANEFRRAKA